MRFKKILVLAIAMLMVTLFMTSCGGGGGTEGKTTIYIGLTGPLTGMGGAYGQDVKAGLDMAINDINAAGGVNIGGTDYIFVLKAADDVAIPEAALANAQRLVLEEGINIIFDPLANTITSLEDINTKAGEEFLIMGYTSIPLYQTEPNKFMIIGPPPFTVLVKNYVTMGRGQGWTKMAMLQTSDAYGVVWGNAMKPAWTAAGGSIVAEALSNYYTETDYTPYITKALAANPDVLFIGGPSDPTALVIDQARSLGFKGGFITMDQAKIDGMAETLGWDKMNGTIGVIPVVNSTAPYMPTFMQQYKDQYNKLVTWETAINYTMFNLLVDSMKIAGSVDDIAAIRAAFAKNTTADPSNFPVEFGGFDNANGQMYMPTQYGIVLNGKFNAQEPYYWWRTP
jgi:branched-chain amino acid transport system substrate-binding protein